MLYLITGPNGGGKSLFAIQRMHKLHKQGVNVYAWNFHGLKLPWVHQHLDPHDWEEMPPNSVMFVDEAQKVWRTRRGNAAPPVELQAMEEHRKQGVDIYLISQDPSYLDSHVKGLVSQHYHYIPYGQSKSRVFTFNEAQDNPKGIAKRANAEFAVVDHPKQHYNDYESAMVHMKKPPIPWRHRLPKFLLWGGAVAVAVLVAYLIFGPSEVKSHGASPAQGPVVASLFGSRSSPAVFVARTPAEYVERFTPRVPLLPYSAPAYDARPVVAEPQLACMSSASSCSCVTEQGTRYVIPEAQCRALARWGPPYNPFKAPTVAPAQVAASGVQGPAPAVEVAPAAAVAVPGASGQAEPVARYGGFRDQGG